MKKLYVPFIVLAIAACDGRPGAPGRAEVGKPAPPLALTSVLRGGVPGVKGWEEFRGKAVMLEFWGPDCDPCVENIPHLNELARKFEKKPMVFISAAIATRAEVEEFLKSHEMSGIVAADTPMDLFRRFRGTGIPHTVLVDKEGRIAAFSYPSMVTEKTLEDLLAGRPLETLEEEGGQEGS